MIRIVLADDHAVMRRGLRLVLEEQSDFTVAGEGNDGAEACALVEQLAPDVVILDITMPRLNGIEAAQQITSKHPRTAVLILSMHTDEAFVLRALKAGAKGYVLKESRDGDLIHAVRLAAQGRSYFSPAVSRMLQADYIRQLQAKDITDSFDLLTARERELLQLIAEGNSNKDIANLLHLSLYTVETHRSNILAKLNLHTVPELILYAVRKGLIR